AVFSTGRERCRGRGRGRRAQTPRSPRGQITRPRCARLQGTIRGGTQGAGYVLSLRHRLALATRALHHRLPARPWQGRGARTPPSPPARARRGPPPRTGTRRGGGGRGRGSAPPAGGVLRSGLELRRIAAGAA